jgi:hypothetical protein
VAFIHGAAGRYLSLDYPELVKLYRDSKTNPEAAIEYERLPASEKRLAKSVCKVYSPPKKKGKTKTRKAGLTKSEKKLIKGQRPALSDETRMRNDIMQGYLNSPDPLLREMARNYLGR